MDDGLDVGTFERKLSPASDLKAELSFSVCSSPVTPIFHRPDQTLIFFDWDDTIFPTYDLIDRLGCRNEEAVKNLPPKQKRDLIAWREATCAYLKESLLLSNHVVIVTNARRPWVDQCIDLFAPELRSVFDDSEHAPKVVYAREKLQEKRGRSLRPVLHSRGTDQDSDSLEEELTFAKFIAMKEEVERFYSRYPNQTWKNILSLGDMHYEHDACQEVTFKRVTPYHKDEKVRTKTIILPTKPTLSEITLRLRFSRIMLPYYVLFDGDIDLDLESSEDPFADIAKALKLPDMLDVPFSRHAWGRQETPADADATQSISNLASAVYKSGPMRPRRQMRSMSPSNRAKEGEGQNATTGVTNLSDFVGDAVKIDREAKLSL